MRDRAGLANSRARVNRAAKGGRVSDDALSQAFEFAAGPVVFGLIGWLIDRSLDTGPLFLIVFAVFGLFGTFATFVIRYQAETARQDEGKPWTRRTH